MPLRAFRLRPGPYLRPLLKILARKRLRLVHSCCAQLDRDSLVVMQSSSESEGVVVGGGGSPRVALAGGRDSLPPHREPQASLAASSARRRRTQPQTSPREERSNAGAREVCCVCLEGGQLTASYRGRFLHAHCMNAVRSFNRMTSGNVELRKRVDAEFNSAPELWRKHIAPLVVLPGCMSMTVGVYPQRKVCHSRVSLGHGGGGGPCESGLSYVANGGGGATRIVLGIACFALAAMSGMSRWSSFSTMVSGGIFGQTPRDRNITWSVMRRREEFRLMTLPTKGIMLRQVAN